MGRYLDRDVTPKAKDATMAWAASFLLFAGCTTLVLRALPTLDLATSFVLVLGLSVCWLVLVRFAPRWLQV
jgi:hypothetical protein